MDPVAIAIVGSHGDPTKAPDRFSDLDLIAVFDTHEIRLLVDRYAIELEKLDGLVSTYLGVHFQFGHVFSLLFTNEPLRWIDIGMMDRNFAENYLVALPMKVLAGHIDTCGIPPHPQNQMLHLAKKLLQARARGDKLYLLTCACRYVTWLKVEAARRTNESHANSRWLALKRGGESIGPETKAFNVDAYLSDHVSEIVDAVLLDIRRRFPEMGSAL